MRRRQQIPLYLILDSGVLFGLRQGKTTTVLGLSTQTLGSHVHRPDGCKEIAHCDVLIFIYWLLRHTGSSLRCVAFSQLWQMGSRTHRFCSLWCKGSGVVGRWLSCPLACGILGPRPEIKPASSELEGRFLTPGPPG